MKWAISVAGPEKLQAWQGNGVLTPCTALKQTVTVYRYLACFAGSLSEEA